jgi:uncharacterized UBP type Zn finger protein
MPRACDDLQRAAARTTAALPRTKGCEECLRSGDEWVHLRLCLACGHVGCCDDSPNKHATKHHHTTGHPVVRSFEPGEAWAYCFLHDQAVDDLPARPGEAARVHYSQPRGRLTAE